MNELEELSQIRFTHPAESAAIPASGALVFQDFFGKRVDGQDHGHAHFKFKLLDGAKQIPIQIMELHETPNTHIAMEKSLAGTVLPAAQNESIASLNAS